MFDVDGVLADDKNGLMMYCVSVTKARLFIKRILVPVGLHWQNFRICSSPSTDRIVHRPRATSWCVSVHTPISLVVLYTILR